MALPHLIKYVYTNGTDEVIRRGKKIHAINYVELINYDELFSSVTFRVKDDIYSTYYKVYIQKFKDPKTLSVRCTCPYNLGDICRHEAAALIQLQELLDKNMLKSEDIEYDQRHTIVRMKFIDLKTLRLLCAPQVFGDAEKYLRAQKANIHYAKDEAVKATVDIDAQTYHVVISKNEERNFDTSCDFPDPAFPLCLPKVIVFLQLLHAHGPYYFDSIRNWDKEKNKLLEAYGYSLSDDLKNKFEFTYKEGKPFLRVLDSSIVRVAPGQIEKSRIAVVKTETAVAAPEEEIVLQGSAKRLGIVFNFNQEAYPWFLTEMVAGESNEEQSAFLGHVEKVDISKFVDTTPFSDAEKQLVPFIRKFQDTEINRYLNRNSPFSGIWENIIHQHDDDLPDETKSLIAEYLHPKLQKLFTDLEHNPFVFYLENRRPFLTANLLQAGISQDLIKPYFRVILQKNGVEIACYVRINGQPVNVTANECKSPLLFLFHNHFYLWRKPDDVIVAGNFLKEERMMIPREEWPKQLVSFVIPLLKDYNVEFDGPLVREIKEGEPEKKLLLQEKGEYLVFQDRKST